MRHTPAQFILTLLLLSALAACVNPNRTYDDAALASRVQSALATSGVETPGVETPGVETPGVETPGVATPIIVVTAYRGIVSLSGEVASDAQREAVVQSVRKVPGVRSVQDSLSVR